MRVVGYAYPWDFAGDPAAAARPGELGVDGVAVAASYHPTRAATPLHPDHRIFEASHAACYVPVRKSAWRGRRLVPVTPGWDRDGGSFESAYGQLAAEGLAVDAWIVLTHNGLLGSEHPDLVVHNAFGDRYPYALCPSAEEVQEYCRTLVAEILATAPVGGVVLEACGPMGIDHGGDHDKTEFAGWDEARRALLSLCFCGACQARFRAAGVDSDRLAQLARAGIDAGSGTVEECLGDELAAAVAAVRAGIAQQLRALLVSTCQAVAPDARITVHGSADPWATGSFPTLRPAAGAGVDAVVANCWEPATGGRQITALRSLTTPRTAVGGYLRLDRGWAAGEPTRQRLEDYLAAGLSELHLYHLGLLGRQGLEDLRGVVETTRLLAARAGLA
jgi:hypothetical protein